VSARDGEIGVARADEVPAAVYLALAHLPDAERHRRSVDTLTLIASGDIDPRGIFVARSEHQLDGVFVCVPLPGASGLVWLPRWRVAPECDRQQRLIDAGLHWLRQRGCRLAQLIVPPEEDDLQSPLWRAGFRPVGPLLSLQHDLATLPTNDDTRQLKRTDDLPDARVMDLVAATYEGTLDFPELGGVRTMAEVFAGHRAAGRHRADWWVGFEDEQPAAVLFLTELEPLGAWDLTYLGVAPRFRRRGWARWLVTKALERVSDLAGSQLEVSVDARNVPALQLYGSLGFAHIGRRMVSLCFLKDAAEHPNGAAQDPRSS
jgi:ribosomal protein S18 acetylase RimI-like enzyme